MAKAIGKAAGGLWWLIGLIMSVIFGRGAAGGVVAALYGVRVRPIPVPPPVTESQRKQAEANRPKAEALVARYLDPAAAANGKAELEAGLPAEIESLIANLGSMRYKVRQAASERLVEIGPVALPALRKAGGHTDVEVAHRAEAAIGAIETRARSATITALRKIPLATGTVLQEKIAESTKARDQARADCTRALQDEDEAAVARAQAAMQAAQIRLQRLQAVWRQVGIMLFEGIPQPLYGVRLP